MYLAYDILGGENGPLRALTRAVTYGVIFGVGFGLIFGLPFGIAVGVTHGLTLAFELTRAAARLPPFGFVWEAVFSAIRGAGYGVGASYTHGMLFGLIFGLLSTGGQIVAYSFGTRPALAYAGDRVPRFNRALVSSALVRTASYAIAGYISATAAHHQMHAAMFGEQIGLAVGVVSAVFAVLTPYIEWAANNIPEKSLGVAGVAMILTGFGLQSVQYWVALLDVPLT